MARKVDLRPCIVSRAFQCLRRAFAELGVKHLHASAQAARVLRAKLVARETFSTRQSWLSKVKQFIILSMRLKVVMAKVI